MNNKEYIKNALDDRTLWEQLAEESSELTQAALKFIRASGYSNNPTPINDTVAYYNVVEELRDVLCVCELLGLKNFESNDAKLERWVKRLEGRKDIIKGRVNAIAIANSRRLYRCSNCDEASFGVPNYYPNCGRYIDGEEVTELEEVKNNG